MLVCCLTAVRPHFIEASQAKFSSLGEPKKGTTNRQTWDMNDMNHENWGIFWVFCTTKTGIWSGWSFLYHVFVCCLNGCPGRFTYWRSGIQILLCGKPMMRQSGKRNGKDMVRIWTWTFVFVSYQTDRLTDNIIQYTHDLEVDLHLLIIQV